MANEPEKYLEGRVWPIEACMLYVREKGMSFIDADTFREVAESRGAKVI